MITLRPFQADLIRQVSAEFQPTPIRPGRRSVLLVSETGSGKTPMATHIMERLAGAAFSCWFLVHRQELARQASEIFSQCGIEHGVIESGSGVSHRPIQVAMIDTVLARLDTLQIPDWLIWDEAHRIIAESRQRLQQAANEQNSRHLGLTATPARTDGRGLGEAFEAMVIGPPMRELINQGYLSDYRYYAPADVDMSDAAIGESGDYTQEAMEAAVTQVIVGSAVAHYLKYAAGLQALAFCPSVPHSKRTAEQFQAAGISAAHVDGDTPDWQREVTLALFAAGKIMVVCSVNLFIEGLNCPNAACAIILRPTESRIVQRQIVGRVLRFVLDKVAIILDCVGNWQRHGLPDWEQEWSLGAAKGTGRALPDEKLLRLRECGFCGGCYEAGPAVCPYCRAAQEIKPRLVRQRAGELELVEAKDAEKRIKQEIQAAKVAKWNAACAAAWALPAKQALAMLRRVCVECEYKRGAAWLQVKRMERKVRQRGG